MYARRVGESAGDWLERLLAMKAPPLVLRNANQIFDEEYGKFIGCQQLC